MKARELMTSKVVAVGANTRTRDVAHLLLANHISAVPVIDEAGAPLGVVSEGDLIGRNDKDRAARIDWWLALLGEGEPLSSEFLASLRDPDRTAQQVMSSPAITVSEDTDAAEVARLLRAHRIKRVPVVRDGRMVGIVSRENLLQALAAGEANASAASKFPGLPDLLAKLIERLEHFYGENEPHAAATAPRSDGEMHAERRQDAPSPESASAVLTPNQLRKISEDASMAKAKQAFARMQLEEKARKGLYDAFMSLEPPANAVERVMATARHIAEQGRSEIQVLRFPASYLDDHGRKINNLESDWPTSLTGSAKQAFEFYEKNLKPLGYRARAQILDYPGGMPGDVGLYLVW